MLHVPEWIVWSHQIAWIRSSNFIVLARPATKVFIKSSSFTEPVSNPRESWKTKCELLRKISSSSMSWIPLWTQLVQFMLPAKYLTRLQGPLYSCKVNLSIAAHQQIEELRVKRYLTFSPRALNISGSSVVLQTHCNIVVLPAFDLPITRILNRSIRSKCFLTCAGSRRKSSSMLGETLGTGAGSVWCVSSVPVERAGAGPVSSIRGAVEACSESTQWCISSGPKERDGTRAGCTWCLSSGSKEIPVAWAGSRQRPSSAPSEMDVTSGAAWFWSTRPTKFLHLLSRW